MIEAKLLNRNIIRVDINENAIARCKEKLHLPMLVQTVGFISKRVMQEISILLYLKVLILLCTHPPYANIIQYSKDISGDLSRLDIQTFLLEMKSVAQECHRVLKIGGYCAILMGDVRQNGFVIPLGFEVMRIFEDAGFRLKENVIKEQHNCHSTTYWKSKSEN